MRSKTLDLLIHTLKCEISNSKLNDQQKEEIILDISNAVYSTEYNLHTDEDIEFSIFSFLEKNGPSSAVDIAKGIGTDLQTVTLYLKDLVNRNEICHNGRSCKGSKYYIDTNPSLYLFNMRIEKLKEIAHLSEQECGVLFLLTLSHTCNEIAKKMVISPHTVKYQIENLKKKLGVSSTRELVWKVIVDPIQV